MTKARGLKDDGALRERLRAAIAEESTVDLDEHLERVLAVVDRPALRNLPTADLFEAVRERSKRSA